MDDKKVERRTERSIQWVGPNNQPERSGSQIHTDEITLTGRQTFAIWTLCSMCWHLDNWPSSFRTEYHLSLQHAAILCPNTIKSNKWLVNTFWHTFPAVRKKIIVPKRLQDLVSRVSGNNETDWRQRSYKTRTCTSSMYFKHYFRAMLLIASLAWQVQFFDRQKHSNGIYQW